MSIARTSSGSSSSARPVKPTRSVKRTVTTFRSSRLTPRRLCRFEPGEDLVLALQHPAVVRDEHGDLARADRALHLVAVAHCLRHLPRDEVDLLLGQLLPH